MATCSAPRSSCSSDTEGGRGVSDAEGCDVHPSSLIPPPFRREPPHARDRYAFRHRPAGPGRPRPGGAALLLLQAALHGAAPALLPRLLLPVRPPPLPDAVQARPRPGAG